jgi:hypothetical protein
MIRSRYAKITVLVPPDDPKIVKGNTSIDHMVTTEDREIELECISSGGKPAAEVSIEKTSIIINLLVFPIHLFYDEIYIKWNSLTCYIVVCCMWSIF